MLKHRCLDLLLEWHLITNKPKKIPITNMKLNGIPTTIAILHSFSESVVYVIEVSLSLSGIAVNTIQGQLQQLTKSK